MAASLSGGFKLQCKARSRSLRFSLRHQNSCFKNFHDHCCSSKRHACPFSPRRQRRWEHEGKGLEKPRAARPTKHASRGAAPANEFADKLSARHITEQNSLAVAVRVLSSDVLVIFR